MSLTLDIPWTEIITPENGVYLVDHYNGGKNIEKDLGNTITPKERKVLDIYPHPEGIELYMY